MSLVCYAFAVVMLGTTLPTPMYTLYATEFGFAIGTSTTIFAAYAMGVVTALILFGRWSDTLGRRPVLLAGLSCSATSSLVFFTAGSVGQLLIGRGLSGLSAGLFTGTATAMIAEIAPPPWKARAMVAAGVANIGGLGIGPTMSGLLAQYGPWPLHLVFATHMAMVASAVLAINQVPETVAQQPHTRLEIQKLSIPPGARPVFVRAAPAAFAGFSIVGLFTSVVPTFLNQSLHTHNKAIAGVVVSTLFLASAVAQVATRRLPARAALILGCTALVLSAVLVAVALATESLPVLIAAAVSGGGGQGISFSKGLDAVVQAAPVSRRGEIASSYFVVAYLAISVPVVGVGLAAQRWSLPAIGLTFGTFVAVVAMSSLMGTLLTGRCPAPFAHPHSANRSSVSQFRFNLRRRGFRRYHRSPATEAMDSRLRERSRH
ncbi:MFS transporter [Nocardia neocaledoniensis]|uniref:MFS transporter n=1 Tax=Nocardia neocaledoniensis TaxID=236511 RepID=UPI00245521E7|nr:MFS transporter [Nocardia neocaledoniensis]